MNRHLSAQHAYQSALRHSCPGPTHGELHPGRTNCRRSRSSSRARRSSLSPPARQHAPSPLLTGAPQFPLHDRPVPGVAGQDVHHPSGRRRDGQQHRGTLVECRRERLVMGAV